MNHQIHMAHLVKTILLRGGVMVKKRLLSQKPLRETGGDTLLELIAVREA